MAELSTFVVDSLLTGLGASYTVEYFDCVNSVAIATYRHTTACNHQTNKVDVKPETYTILQRKLTQRQKGYSCTILHSSIVHYCGAYSYSNVAQWPEVEIPEPILREDRGKSTDLPDTRQQEPLCANQHHEPVS